MPSERTHNFGDSGCHRTFRQRHQKFLKPSDETLTITATLKADDGKTVSSSYSFTVLPNNVETLTLVGEAIKTSYYEREDVSLDGLTVVATYSNGRTEELKDGIYTVEPATLTTTGTQTITVTYEGQTASFEVEVLHNGEWMVTHEATCSEPGSREYYCFVCGNVVETEAIPATEHECEWVVTQEATPDEPGIKSFICQTCGETVETKEIVWCDHAFESEVTEPRCDEKGYTTYTCSKCGEVVISDYTDALEHQYDAKIAEPSCGKSGLITIPLIPIMIVWPFVNVLPFGPLVIASQFFHTLSELWHLRFGR